MNFCVSKDDEHELDSIGLEEVMAQFRAIGKLNLKSKGTSAYSLHFPHAVCEELSEKSKEVDKLKLKQSEDLERYIRLDQYLEEVST
eukprot:gene22560-29686_t